MKKRYDVIGIESPCMDFPLNVDALPGPNEKITLNAYSWQGGGKVSTGMIAAARLGAKCCQIGVVGDDLAGRACLADFKRHGVDASHILVREGCTTGLSVVLSDRATHGRSILYAPGSDGKITDEEIPWELLKEARYYFTAHCYPQLVKAAKVARAAGAEVLMDADSYGEDVMENLDCIDYLIASEFFYRALFSDDRYEEHCRELQKRGPKVVVVTLGARGCVGVDEQGAFFALPAFDVPVTDTLGCGDVFHGAFLAGLVQGWATREAARFACAVSSIKATRIGGRAGIPDLAAALHFLETGEIDGTELDRREAEYQRGLEL